MIDTVALREKVLDLAIRGKLVPQDSNDEPASVLLERIRVQKQQMVKDGKLKAKDIKDDSIIFVGEDNLHYEKFADGTVKCIEDEIPFELPEGWAWARLSMVGTTNIGLTYKPSDVADDGTIVLRSCNIKNGKIDLGDLVRVQTDIRDNQYIENNDILICARNGSRSLVGKCAVMSDIGEKVSFGAFMAVFRSLCFRYVYHFFNTSLFRSAFDNDDSKQINQVTQAILRDTIIPLPPFAEQERIASTLDEVFALVELVDKETENVEVLIKNTKANILDLAIRGKLVPQNSADEPASVLLERIKAEKEELIKAGKIKRDKKESVIFKGEDNSYYLIQNKKAIPADETIVFDLPNSWCWTTLPTIANVELGKTLDRAKNSGTLYPYLRSVNIKWGDIDLSDLNETRFEDDELEKYSVIKNDLLICEGGDVGRCCVWNIDEVFLYQNALHRARMYANIEPKFYQYVLMSYESKGILKRISNGVTIKHLTGTTLSFMPIPLPPAEEQLRIIETIELLFAKLDAIKESLN